MNVIKYIHCLHSISLFGVESLSSIYSKYRGEIVQDGIELSLGNRTQIGRIASWSEPF